MPKRATSFGLGGFDQTVKTYSIDIGGAGTIYFKSKRLARWFWKMSPEDSTNMTLTLGEKLRQAREERGFTVSEVSEQTRISSLYLESIENDDYSNLPGGIFNKGFVKSYAKFVGINEQEALLDYTRLISAVEGEDDGELKQYKPEIFTDEGGGRSMFPTFVVAILILGAMTAAILFGVNYLRRQSETPVVSQASITNVNSNTNSNSISAEANANKESDNTAVPQMDTLKVEFRALGEPVSLTATNDGKTGTSIVTPGAAATFEPKTSLKLSYSRSLANFVQLMINGKQIALPAAPLEPRRNAIAFEINSGNLAQIWSSGSISSDVPAAVVEPSVANAATAAPRTTPMPRASVAAPPVETVPKTPLVRPSASPKPPTMTGRPPTMTGKPPANRPQ